MLHKTEQLSRENRTSYYVESRFLTEMILLLEKSVIEPGEIN